MEILYIKGDATAPIGSGVKVITHICNDIARINHLGQREINPL